MAPNSRCIAHYSPRRFPFRILPIRAASHNAFVSALLYTTRCWEREWPSDQKHVERLK